MITEGAGIGNDKHQIVVFEFSERTYTYRMQPPNTYQGQEFIWGPMIHLAGRKNGFWTLDEITNSTELNVAAQVQMVWDDTVNSSMPMEILIAILPGGTTAGTIEEEFNAPDGERSYTRVGIAFGIDVLETLTLYGKLKNGAEAASVYRALAVAHGANAVYAGTDAAFRFANGEDGAWAKSLEALLSVVAGSASAKTLVADFEAAAKRLAAAAANLKTATHAAARDMAIAGKLTLRSLNTTAFNITTVGERGFKELLANFRDARQVRAFFREIEASMQKHYVQIVSQAAGRGLDQSLIGKLVGRAVEDEMIAKFGGKISGASLGKEVIVNFRSRGIVGIRQDGLARYRIADLTLEGREKLAIELTLEDLRDINKIATWRRMSRHKNGQLSDYALGGYRIVIITPW